MMGQTKVQTPLKQVRAMGSAKSGTGHFFRSRTTGLALGLLTLPFLVILVHLQGADHARLVAAMSNPFVAVTVLLVVAISAYHMQLGMQVIIEDYVHSEGRKIAALIANSFFSWALGAAAVFAVLKMAFRG